MSTKAVTATIFKAKCLSILDEVNSTGNSITVTKRGHPVATVGPARKQKRPSTEGILRGKIHISDEDLMADMSDMWECVREKEALEL